MPQPSYQLHHLCIFERQPRDAMWNWLRWYHAIPAYYWEGLPDLHHTGEGGVDYTFLACGGPFQMQMEAPPYQFEYERNWFEQHDSAINHICWIVPSADGAPEGLEILALTPVTLEEEDHGQAGNLISIADGDLAFAAEALYGEDTPESRDRVRYGSAVITAMAKGDGEVFCAGTTEWCHALARGDIQVETITRNVLDRFLARTE